MDIKFIVLIINIVNYISCYKKAPRNRKIITLKREFSENVETESEEAIQYNYRSCLCRKMGAYIDRRTREYLACSSALDKIRLAKAAVRPGRESRWQTKYTVRLASKAERTKQAGMSAAQDLLRSSKNLKRTTQFVSNTERDKALFFRNVKRTTLNVCISEQVETKFGRNIERCILAQEVSSVIQTTGRITFKAVHLDQDIVRYQRDARQPQQNVGETAQIGEVAHDTIQQCQNEGRPGNDTGVKHYKDNPTQKSIRPHQDIINVIQHEPDDYKSSSIVRKSKREDGGGPLPMTVAEQPRIEQDCTTNSQEEDDDFDNELSDEEYKQFNSALMLRDEEGETEEDKEKAKLCGQYPPPEKQMYGTTQCFLACITIGMPSGPNFTCTGTIVAKRFILTAAFCFYDEKKSTWTYVDWVTVYLGRLYCDLPGGMRFKPVFIHVYEDYVRTKKINLAMVELPYDLHVCPMICIMKMADYDPDGINMLDLIMSNTSFESIGYSTGWVDEQKQPIPHTIPATMKPIYLLPPGYCLDKIKYFDGVTEVCALAEFVYKKGDTYKNHCIPHWGYNGGPLYQWKPYNCVYGVINREMADCIEGDFWGEKCEYVTYTRVDTLRDFLESAMFKSGALKFVSLECVSEDEEDAGIRSVEVAVKDMSCRLYNSIILPLTIYLVISNNCYS